MKVKALTDIGLIRKKNQDSFFLSENQDLPLFIIADGMGGHKGGEVASSDAINIINKIFIENKEILINEKNIKDVIHKSIEKANKDIYKKSLEFKEYKGMGTTVSLCYIFQDHVFIGHVGDSRIYKIENEDIAQITEDHSLVNELIKKGEITKEEAYNHPQKNMITRAVGTSYDLEIDLEEFKYKKDDKILLCTDGVFNMLHDFEILEIIKNNIFISEAIDELISRAKKNGGLDNITAIIIQF